MLEAVFFDLDGTLLDTAPDFDTVLNGILQRENLPQIDHQQIRTHVSHGARALVELGFGVTVEANPEAFEQRLNQLLDAYGEHLDVHTRLFDGLEHSLQWLKQQGIPWGVVTNKPDRFAGPVMAGSGLLDDCQALICPDHVEQRKPDPEGLLLACKQAGNVKPEHCIYVGDHKRDIHAGQNAGMKTVAALYGYISPDENPLDWQADYAIENASDLLAILQQVAGSHLQTHPDRQEAP